MFLATRDGIRCDICGTIHRDKFTYYSVDWNTIKVDTGRQMVAPVPDTESFDVCSGCYEGFLSACKSHMGKARPQQTKCDFCPQYMKGVFDYTRAMFTKVEVDIKQKEEGPLAVEKRYMDFNICGKCKSGIVNKITHTRDSLKNKGDWS
jgi:hypothetical protein